MGHEQSTQAEVAGQANTNVVVEQSIEKIDVFHSVILLVLLVLLIAQNAYTAVKHYQKALKKKYLERIHKSNGLV